LAEAPARADVAAQPQPAPFHTLNVRGEPFRGGARARVAIVEFSDFNCSHCAQFETNVYPRLDETYLRTGRVKYLFRDLPDRLDADALAKAEAARCAGEQGKFWEMHDRLFADPLPFGGENAARHVAALGIDAGKFDACLQSHRYREPIRRSAAMAARMEIHGTPAFLVGTVDESGDVVQSTRIFMGAESFESFRGELDALLEAASKPKK
jgi:protein-disulfide isomerase